MVVALRPKKIRRIRRKVRRKRRSQQADIMPTQQATIASPSFQNALQSGELSPDQMIQLQSIVGNRAMQGLTQSADPQIRPKVTSANLPPQFLSHDETDAMVQRLPTSVAFDKDVKKDVKKHEKKLAKEKEKDDKSEKEKDDKDDGFFAQIANFISGVVNSVIDSMQKQGYENLLKALDDFHTFHKEYKKMKPEYVDLGKFLMQIKDVEVASTQLLTLLKSDDPRTKHVQDLKNEAVDLFLKQSPNAARAKDVKKKLKAKQKDNADRITDELVDMLVMAVAMPMNLTDNKGQAGVIGIDQALKAVDTLILLSDTDYSKMIGLLDKSGDDWGQVAQKATLLKALAARKKDLETAGPQSDAALEKIEKFAEKIRDMKRGDMIKNTKVTDRGGGDGLQQRFTMSCGPTSITIVHGDYDPIYAMELNKEGLHKLDSTGKAADRQKRLLEQVNGVDTALPREVEDDWEKVDKAANTRFSSGTNAEKAQLRAVYRWLAGQASNATRRNKGFDLLKTLGTGVNIDTRKAQFKKFYGLLTNGAPGLGNQSFANLASQELKKPTGRDFNETAIKYKEKIIGGKKQLRGKIAKHFGKLDKALFAGKSVPLGVMWAGGGGHFMVFSDIRTEKKGLKKIKYYLVSDPWQGTSGWMSRKDLIRGSFNKIGMSQGAIDSIYL